MPLWSPSRVTTSLWFDGATDSSLFQDTGVQAVDTSSILQWSDLSGNGRHATQGTLSSRPTKQGSILNGLPVVRFDGVNDALSTSWAPSGAQSVFCVVANRRPTTPANTVDFVFGTGSPGSGQPGFAGSTLNTFTGPADQRKWRQDNNSVPIFVGVNGQTVNVSTDLNAFNICELIYSTTTTSSVFQFCQTGGYFGQNDIAEFILLPRAASLEERQTFEGYLAHRWSLHSKLSSDHPYKNYPPLFDETRRRRRQSRGSGL